METKERTYALVTGATGGLGKAFVFALAKRGTPLALTGRRLEKLQALKEELFKAYPQLSVEIFPAGMNVYKRKEI